MTEPADYESKVAGGWLGKNIGGTLGGPYEGSTGIMHLYYYNPVPKEAVPNDDLELQLVWLDMLEKKGILFSPSDFAPYWLHHIRYHIAEYFMAQRNLAAGLMPPASGSSNNWWQHGMGATIRSEIWAMLAPGLPDIAAAYAYMDGSTDHAAEGLHGEMFFAAMESAAFVERDPHALLETGLRYIPADSPVRGVVDLVVRGHRQGMPPTKLRHLVCADYAHPADFTFVPVNVGFIVLGLLYGDDFGDAICRAVNCGYDTDCTGATLGALLGIEVGAENLPRTWAEPMGDRIVVGPGIPGIAYPQTIGDLTKRVCALGRRVLADPDAVRHHIHRWTGLPHLRNGGVFALPTGASVRTAGEDLAVCVDYGGDPAIAPGETRQLDIELSNENRAEQAVQAHFTAPEGWGVSVDGVAFAETARLSVQVPGGGLAAFPLWVRTGETVAPGSEVELTVESAPGVALRTKIALLAKTCWRVTPPIPLDDEAAIQAHEQAGALDDERAELCCIELATDDLGPLVPERGNVVFAQSAWYAEEKKPVRLLANNTGPIAVFLNGRRVVDKRHRLEGLMPSAHLQQGTSPILPLDAGFADVVLEKGWNTVMIRLEGTSYAQDVCFHMMEAPEARPGEPEWMKFKPLSGVHG